MNLEIVAAISDRWIIGANNRLPWHIPADLKRFRSITQGHSVIMGRKTWEGLSGPFGQRQNIVVSGKLHQTQIPQGVALARSMKQALQMVDAPLPAFAIGGTEIYRDALPHAEKMYITEIHHDFPGDVFFPVFNMTEWFEAARTSYASTDTVPFAYDFVEYCRR